MDFSENRCCKLPQKHPGHDVSCGTRGSDTAGCETGAAGRDGRAGRCVGVAGRCAG